MEQIFFKGPYKLDGNPSVIEHAHGINGVYLWCVKGDDCVYRVYYVGEAIDVGARMSTHLTKHLSGEYTGHCIDSLKKNIKILMHRAGEGMVPRFSHIDSREFNRAFVKDLFIFFAPVPVIGQANDDKWSRCRYETGISHQIENSGQNILSVGHLRYWKEQKSMVHVDTGSNNIEHLSNQMIDI